MLSLPGARADAVTLHHDLKVTLFPLEKRLTDNDEIALRAIGEDALKFYLSKRATLEDVEISGRSKPYVFSEGQLRIPK